MLRSLMQNLILGCIWGYKYGISWALPDCCRFTPSCSAYAREAVIVHGPWRGLWFASRRLCRCHPFSRACAFDPVPLKNNN